MEILDVLNLSVALTTLQGNSTAVIAPVLNSLNEFFAQVVAVIPRIIAAGIILFGLVHRTNCVADVGSVGFGHYVFGSG